MRYFQECGEYKDAKQWVEKCRQLQHEIDLLIAQEPEKIRLKLIECEVSDYIGVFESYKSYDYVRKRQELWKLKEYFDKEKDARQFVTDEKLRELEEKLEESRKLNKKRKILKPVCIAVILVALLALGTNIF